MTSLCIRTSRGNEMGAAAMIGILFAGKEATLRIPTSTQC